MTTIKGERHITIAAEADETYCIDYGSTFTVGILNQTIGTLTISEHYPARSVGVVSNCIRLGGNTFYNELTINGSKLYLTPSASGDITVVRSK